MLVGHLQRSFSVQNANSTTHRAQDLNSTQPRATGKLRSSKDRSVVELYQMSFDRPMNKVDI